MKESSSALAVPSYFKSSTSEILLRVSSSPELDHILEQSFRRANKLEQSEECNRIQGLYSLVEAPITKTTL